MFIFYGNKDNEKRLTKQNMEFFFENNAINLCKSEYKHTRTNTDKDTTVPKREQDKIKAGILGPLVDLFFLLDHD